MGTRSITTVNDEDGRHLVTLYRQCDGYPTGHGADLLEFAKGLTLVNGIGAGTPKKAANGMGCFAAQLISYFKKDIGGFYLVPPGDHDQDYEYVITSQELVGTSKLYLHVYGTSYNGPNILLYSGWLDDFDPKKTEEDANKEWRECDDAI